MQKFLFIYKKFIVEFFLKYFNLGSVDLACKNLKLTSKQLRFMPNFVNSGVGTHLIVSKIELNNDDEENTTKR